MIALGFSVAGCADGELFGSRPVEVAAPTPAHPPKPQPVAATPPAPEPEAKPKRPPVRRAAPAAAEAPRPPGETQTAAASAPAPADLRAQPPQLIGLTQPETVTLLGAPSAQWDRPPARVWHYQGPDCAVDVFFYLDVSRNEFSALRYTAAGADGSPATGQHCLTRIRDVAQRR